MYATAALVLSLTLLGTGSQEVSKIGSEVLNPCDAQDVGRIGFDPAWLNTVLIEEWFPRALVCAPFAGSVDGLARKYADMSPAELELDRRMNERRRDLSILGYARAITAIRALPQSDQWTRQNERDAQALVSSGVARRMIEEALAAQTRADR